MNKIYFYLIICLISSSCVSNKKIVYFQGAENAIDETKVTEAKIQPNDNLLILVSSPKVEVSDIFNSIQINERGNSTQESLALQGYIVDKDGYINFPILGRVRLGGLTKNEAINLLQDKISEYVVESTVNIRFLNFRVTVLGEVNKPGVYTVTNETISLPEALGLAGDMTIHGRRNNVLVCREVDGKKEFYRMDMTSPDLFRSPNYFLQQNDIVYIQPNKAKSSGAGYNQNLPIWVSVFSTIITIIALVTK
ncbi:MAG: polysaccharide biosynthesis/export family protein [Tannerella sp.]|jgi:polysaccharide export outer membrane protein|nr:polysaccharide biosynthesis/export family protein [Tannerella sp.]